MKAKTLGMLLAVLLVGLSVPNAQAIVWWVTADPGIWTTDASGSSLTKQFSTSDAYGVACGTDGYTYVARYANHWVERYNTYTAALDPNWQVSFGSGNPYMAKMGPDGYLYISDDSNKTVYKIDTSTQTKTAVATIADLADFAFDGSGKVYVAQYYPTQKVRRYDTGSTWTADGWSVDQGYAYGVTVKDNNLYVSNYWNTVFKWDISSQTQIWASATGGYAKGLAFGADGNLYVAVGSHGVLRTDPTTPAWQTFVVLSPYGYPTGEVAGFLSEGGGPMPNSISVTPGSRDVASPAGQTTFTVQNTGTGSGMTWTATVTSGAEWLSITGGSSGTGNGTITVSFTQNIDTDVSRIGTIRIASSGATGSPRDVTVVQAKMPLLPGDANKDGKVDVSDLGILAANYGTTSGAAWAMGDFNNDGKVDVSDLGILAANYGTGTGTALDFNKDAETLGLTLNREDKVEAAPSISGLCGMAGLPLIAGLFLVSVLVKLDE